MRHPSTEHVMRYFDYDHLPEDLRQTSYDCKILAEQMVNRLPDSPELTVGLRKLLEAKDAFVRAAVDKRESH